MVANLDTGIYAFLSSIVSPSLKLLCRLPAFRISEIITRSCHISLQYLTFFFHSKSGSNCQQADLSSRRVSPFEGIFLSPSQGSQKPQLALTWHLFFIRRPVGMAENHEKQILWLASMVKLLDTSFLGTRVWFLNGMWSFCVLGTQSEKWKPLTKVRVLFISSTSCLGSQPYWLKSNHFRSDAKTCVSLDFWIHVHVFSGHWTPWRFH